jgi:hypothetical protein
MYGFNRREYKKTKKLIDTALQLLDLGDDAVTTRINSDVRSCDGNNKRMPYVVVRSTGGIEEVEKIVHELIIMKIRVDCEKEPLIKDGFVPAKKMG